jgi:hypothetical protein
MFLLLACADPSDTADTAPDLDLPAHNDCLPEGEEMTEDICLAVVEEAGKYPTVSENKSGLDPVEDDPRLQDPELAWVTSEINRCACRCCHTKAWGGPGVYFWDLDWTPVWTDSASLWTLSVFGGWTEEYAQTFPSSDMERLRSYIEAEADRRREARDAQGP